MTTMQAEKSGNSAENSALATRLAREITGDVFFDPFNRGPHLLGLPGGFPVIFAVFSASLLVGALLILKVPEVRRR